MKKVKKLLYAESDLDVIINGHQENPYEYQIYLAEAWQNLIQCQQESFDGQQVEPSFCN